MQNSSSHHSISSLNAATQRPGGKALPPLSKYYYGPAQTRSSSEKSLSSGSKQMIICAWGQLFTNLFSNICVASQRIHNTSILPISAALHPVFPSVTELINAMAITWSSAFGSTTKSSHFCFIQSQHIWADARGAPVPG